MCEYALIHNYYLLDSVKREESILFLEAVVSGK